MKLSVTRMGMAVSVGSLLAGAPLLVSCAPSAPSGPSYSQWAATDGAAGRINLDDVQDAFKKSDSATQFEARVNEIYEGDGIILIRALQTGDRLTLEGWEDLDSNGAIDDASDDQLFSIVKEDDRHRMQGHHANSHYNSSFGAGDFLFTYLIVSAMMPGRVNHYHYQTGPRPGQHHTEQPDPVSELRAIPYPTEPQRAVRNPSAEVLRFQVRQLQQERESRPPDLPKKRPNPRAPTRTAAPSAATVTGRGAAPAGESSNPAAASPAAVHSASPPVAGFSGGGGHATLLDRNSCARPSWLG